MTSGDLSWDRFFSFASSCRSFAGQRLGRNSSKQPKFHATDVGFDVHTGIGDCSARRLEAMGSHVCPSATRIPDELGAFLCGLKISGNGLLKISFIPPGRRPETSSPTYRSPFGPDRSGQSGPSVVLPPLAGLSRSGRGIGHADRSPAGTFRSSEERILARTGIQLLVHRERDEGVGHRGMELTAYKEDAQCRLTCSRKRRTSRVMSPALDSHESGSHCVHREFESDPRREGSVDTARNRKDAQEPHNEKHGLNHSLFPCVKQHENDAHTHQWQPERADDCAVEKDEISPILQDVHGGDQEA